MILSGDQTSTAVFEDSQGFNGGARNLRTDGSIELPEIHLHSRLKTGTLKP